MSKNSVEIRRAALLAAVVVLYFALPCLPTLALYVVANAAVVGPALALVVPLGALAVYSRRYRASLAYATPAGHEGERTVPSDYTPVLSAPTESRYFAPGRLSDALDSFLADYRARKAAPVYETAVLYAENAPAENLSLVPAIFGVSATGYCVADERTGLVYDTGAALYPSEETFVVDVVGPNVPLLSIGEGFADATNDDDKGETTTPVESDESDLRALSAALASEPSCNLPLSAPEPLPEFVVDPFDPSRRGLAYVRERGGKYRLATQSDLDSGRKLFRKADRIDRKAGRKATYVPLGTI